MMLFLLCMLPLLRLLSLLFLIVSPYCRHRAPPPRNRSLAGSVRRGVLGAAELFLVALGPLQDAVGTLDPVLARFLQLDVVQEELFMR